MKQKITLSVLAFALSVSLADATEIRGKVTKDGIGAGGVFVSAHDTENRKASGVFTAADGTYVIDGLREKDYRVRARQKGLIDVLLYDITAGSTGIEIKMTNATGWKLERQRTADSAFGMLKFDDLRDKLNFKMYCTYCHQVGTVGFRTPEEPVDWETMIHRMHGFGALYPHTKRTIVKRIMDTYTGDAVDQWPEFESPPPPTGAATKAKITWWEMGKRYESQYHDIDLTPDGRLLYAVNITKQYMVTVDTKTDEQVYRKFPRITMCARARWQSTTSTIKSSRFTAVPRLLRKEAGIRTPCGLTRRTLRPLLLVRFGRLVLLRLGGQETLGAQLGQGQDRGKPGGGVLTGFA